MADLRRWFAALVVASLCATLILVGDASPAYGVAACDQTNPQADVSVSQTPTEVGFHVSLTNHGPCNVPDAVLIITLPALTNPISVSVSTNPSSWTCRVAVDSTPPPPPPPTVVTCSESAPTIGVPSTHDFFVTFTPPSATTALAVTAEGTLGDGAADCELGDGNAATTCDPKPGNNISCGFIPGFGGSDINCGFITDLGGSIQAGADGDQQTTKVNIPEGHPGAVQIQQLAGVACPTAFQTCFGKLVSIQSVDTGLDRQLKVFTYRASDLPPSFSFGKLTMIHCPISQCPLNSELWTTPPPCGRSDPLPPTCILSKKKFGKGVNLFFQVLVSTSVDDSWFGD